MTPCNFIQMVEKTFDVISVQARNVQVWQILRHTFAAEHHRRSVGVGSGARALGVSPLRRVCNLFYGWQHWLRRYDYISFSSSGSRSEVQGKLVDRVIYGLRKHLDQDRVLTVEIATRGRHISQARIDDHHIVSSDVFYFMAMLPRFGRKVRIEREDILQRIKAEYHLDIDYDWEISVFFRLVRAFDICLRLWRPKAIFVSCYYNLVHLAAIHSARKLGIKTVELQHGRIGKNNHYAYNVACQLDRSCFPEFLLTYGDYVRDVFGPGNYFIPPENVLTAGNWYIEYLAGSVDIDEALLAMLQKYTRSVAVTLQWSVEKEMLDFIRTAAKQNNEILYILIPRDPTKDYSGTGLPSNVRILEHLGFYQIVRHTDFHATVCSTCALEAPALGTPNILIDLKGWARDYYAEVLTDTSVTRFVDTVEEFVNTVFDWDVADRAVIRESHSGFFKPGQQMLMAKLLRERVRLDCS